MYVVKIPRWLQILELTTLNQTVIININKYYIVVKKYFIISIYNIDK